MSDSFKQRLYVRLINAGGYTKDVRDMHSGYMEDVTFRFILNGNDR